MNMTLATQHLRHIHPLYRDLLISFGAAVILGISAHIRIPLPTTPVPLTLQTFALLLLAAKLRAPFSVLMVVWYVGLGALGLPYFASAGGLASLTGPTGGYLIGFLATAFFVGKGCASARHPLSRLLVFMIGAGIVYIPGVLQLKLVTGVPWGVACSLGIAPFLLGDLIKAVAAWTALEVPRVL